MSSLSLFLRDLVRLLLVGRSSSLFRRGVRSEFGPPPVLFPISKQYRFIAPLQPQAGPAGLHGTNREQRPGSTGACRAASRRHRRHLHGLEHVCASLLFSKFPLSFADEEMRCVTARGRHILMDFCVFAGL